MRFSNAALSAVLSAPAQAELNQPSFDDRKLNASSSSKTNRAAAVTTTAPAIFQNPQAHHCHDGFVPCIISKDRTNGSFYFYFLQDTTVNNNAFASAPAAPTMIARRVTKNPIKPLKYRFYDTFRGSSQPNTYLGKLKKVQPDRFALWNDSDKTRPSPSQVATFWFQSTPSTGRFLPPLTSLIPPPPLVAPATRTSRMPQVALCRGASCRDLLQHVVEKTDPHHNPNVYNVLRKHKYTLQAQVNKHPNHLIHLDIDDSLGGIKRNSSTSSSPTLIKLKNHDGQELLVMSRVNEKTDTIHLSFREPLNAFQAFGFVLAAIMA